jgi:hypothetical protein
MVMHPLHDYVAKQLAEKLQQRKVVVWYDERGEFAPFVKEIRGGSRPGPDPVVINIAALKIFVLEYAGSMFELRAFVEPHVCNDSPDTVLIYLPGCERDRNGSVLMELEKGGTTPNTSCSRNTRLAWSMKCSLSTEKSVTRISPLRVRIRLPMKRHPFYEVFFTIRADTRDCLLRGS